jgi:hypothetical protein
MKKKFKRTPIERIEERIQFVIFIFELYEFPELCNYMKQMIPNFGGIK